MNFLLGIITYNRLPYLKNLIESWDKTRDKNHTYELAIADDASQDGTRDYINSLSFSNTKIIPIFNNRREVHHQVNSILNYSLKTKYDLGFMAEDDMFFIDNGWDNAYYEAYKLNGYDHLCFFDKDWAKKYRGQQVIKDQPIINKEKKVQCYLSNNWEVFGVFWTFTKKVVKSVGYFDLENFGLWSSAHTDFSHRCCRAGFNSANSIFDVLESEKYLKMFYDNYIPAISGNEINFAMYYKIPNPGHKGNTIADRSRIYIGYNELPYNMKGEAI